MLFPTFDKWCLMVEIIEIKVLRQRIIDELTALNHLRTQARDSRAPVQLDQQSVGRLSRIDAMQQQALMVALKRVETSDYGYCLNCDDAIGVGRLGIDPAVTLYEDCA